jgi:hypothetical protein
MRLLRGSKEVGNDQNRTRPDKLLYRPQSHRRRRDRLWPARRTTRDQNRLSLPSEFFRIIRQVDAHCRCASGSLRTVANFKTL